MKVKNVLRAVARFARAKKAVSALEYAVVVSVVVAGVGGAVVAFMDSTEDAIEEIGKKVVDTAKTAPTGPISGSSPGPGPAPGAT